VGFGITSVLIHILLLLLCPQDLTFRAWYHRSYDHFQHFFLLCCIALLEYLSVVPFPFRVGSPPSCVLLNVLCCISYTELFSVCFIMHRTS
jgi:hypothetical protein